MAKNTTNYGFVKPELTDAPPDITVMNQNWDIIDEQLKKAVDGTNITAEDIGAFARYDTPHSQGYNTILGYIKHLMSRGIFAGSFNAINCTDAPEYREGWGYNVCFYVSELVVVWCNESYDNLLRWRTARENASAWIDADWVKPLLPDGRVPMTGELEYTDGENIFKYYGEHNPQPFGDLIWENASPTSTFNEQTVTLDLSKYRFVLISIGEVNTDSYNFNSFSVCRVGTSSRVFIPNTQGRVFRRVDVSNNGVLFSIGYNNNTSDAKFAVPKNIYGIK